jgi:hypothetical protein
MSYLPEDVMPENKNHFEKNGITIRKGSMAAVLANAKIFESKNASTEEKRSSIDAIKKLAPTLIAFELTMFLQWKNPEIQQIFDNIK